MDVQIRPAAPADYAELCEVFAEIDSYHARALPHIFQTPPGPARSRAYVRGILDDPDAALFVAVADGEIVGLVDVRQHTTADIPILVPRRFAVIDAIVVRRAFWGQGMGRALMHRAESWARERELGEVLLNVWEFNRRAIEFYEGLGYETISRRMRRTLGGGE
ncbi:MAG TPA: GNAT family N-acetyltransferase [Aggregatilineales bacterium]|nr:GNAT family N-acetyltransferase [Aggregatilineales bacterium]